MPDETDVELPRGIALAWGVAAAPQRGPKREMSIERIVEAAVGIADAEGLSAVSMAAVAAKLGYTPMSLYRYVSAKEDLILLMQEEATGLPSEELRTAGGWRAQLEVYYREQVALYLAHPWVLEIPILGSPTTPNSAAWMDAGLRALAASPLDYRERVAVLLLVSGVARWTGLVIAGYARSQREAGVGDADLAAREDALYRALVTADEFPELRAAIDAGIFLDETDPFAFALERALDGVAAYIERRASGGPSAAVPVVADLDADIADDKRYREARKAVREAEKALRAARKAERQAAREAHERRQRAATVP